MKDIRKAIADAFKAINPDTVSQITNSTNSERKKNLCFFCKM